MNDQRLNLGDRAKDSISGFMGIITSRHEYLHGCVQLGLTPEKLDKDGNLKDGKVFDEAQIDLVEPGAKLGAAMRHNVPRSPGGPVREAEPRTQPRR